MSRVPPSWCDQADRVDLLADGALEGDERAAMERHLERCPRCHRAYTVVRGVQRALGSDAVPASAGLRRRIRENAGASTVPRSARWPWLGWAVAAALSGLWIGQDLLARQHEREVPMVQAAVADYRLHLRTELPVPHLGALTQEVGFPVRPLAPARATLIAAWPVSIRGTVSAALAYRVGNDVVVQYLVKPALFFRQPLVRRAVRQTGAYRAHAGGVQILAWPEARSGSLLVGPVSPAVLQSLRM